MDCYKIRDCVISGEISLETYLLKEEQLLIKNPNYIEMFYGSAISASNLQNISLLNLFTREHNIILNRMNIIEEIYWADFREEYAKRRNLDILISPVIFNDSIPLQEKYIEKYWPIFKLGFKHY